MTPFRRTPYVFVGSAGAIFSATLSIAGAPLPPTFSTYLGGMIADQLRDIAIDAEGNVYVAGGASSSDFPVTPGAYQTTHFDTPSNPAITPYDVVVAKFAPSGQLIWSTFIGGPNYDRAYAIEIAPDGTIFVAGRAGAGFPVTAGAFQTQFLGGQEAAFYGPQDGFVCRLSADGSQLLWASYFGTSDFRIIRDIGLDAAGDVYLASSHASGSYPAAVAAAFAGSYRPNRAGGADGVVAKVRGDGSQVLWATHVGGTADEAGGPSIRVGADGSAYYLTTTKSADAPTTPNAYDPSYSGVDDLYIVRVAPDGASLIFATYLGGAQLEALETHNLSLDAAGNLFCGGVTRSTDFPVTPGAFQSLYGGGTSDAFAAKLSPDGTTLLASTFCGGSGNDFFQGVGTMADGSFCAAGGTTSPNFPVTADAFQSGPQGVGDAVAVVLSADLSQAIYSTVLGGPSDDSGRAAAAGHGGRFAIAGQSAANGFPTAQPAQPTNRGDLDGIVSAFTLPSAVILGDMNCDGFTTVGDIGGFVLAVTDPAAYAAQFPACDIDAADVNQDTVVSVGDISGFVALLTGP